MLSKRLTLIWAHMGLTRGQLEASLPPGDQEKGVIRRHVDKGFLQSTSMTRTGSSAGRLGLIRTDVRVLPASRLGGVLD